MARPNSNSWMWMFATPLRMNSRHLTGHRPLERIGLPRSLCVKIEEEFASLRQELTELIEQKSREAAEHTTKVHLEHLGRVFRPLRRAKALATAGGPATRGRRPSVATLNTSKE